MHIVICDMWYNILVTAFTNFLLHATTDWRTIADITDFHIDFSFAGDFSFT